MRVASRGNSELWRPIRAVRLVPASLALALVLSVPAHRANAEDISTNLLGNSAVQYRAKVRVRVSGQALHGTLYARPGMQRHEYGDGRRVLIVRFDLGRAWTLDRKSGTYRDEPIDRLVSGLPNVLYRPSLEIVREEAETVRGVRLRRWRFTTHNWRKTKRTGVAWIDGQGVVRRVIASVLARDMRADLVYDVRSLVVSPQPAWRFTIPSGYREADRQPRWPATGLPSGPTVRLPQKRALTAPMMAAPTRPPYGDPSATSSRQPGDMSLESLFAPKK